MSDARPRDAPGGSVPRHVAVIMDGNGRWAAARHLPRSAGHRAGLKPVRLTVEACTRHGCEALTLFAFSSENWARPAPEVGLLMRLFLEAIDQEIDELASQGVRVRFIGERAGLAAELLSRIVAAEARTRTNARLTLTIALAYGGRWDLVQASRALALKCQRGELQAQAIDERALAGALALGDLPDPDLFIRTGGERRISNFLLWNLAYTELWFSDVLWPDFGERELALAFDFYAGRERRYGRVGSAAEPA